MSDCKMIHTKDPKEFQWAKESMVARAKEREEAAASPLGGARCVQQRDEQSVIRDDRRGRMANIM